MIRQGSILVPLDFSPECCLILEFAEKHAEQVGGHLLLLHVAGFRDPLRQRPPVLLMDPLEDCAHAVTRIPKDRVDILMLEGEPVHGILEAADQHRCPMIIMGRGGTVERPGHVALAVQKTFLGKTHLVSRFEVEAPLV